MAYFRCIGGASASGIELEKTLLGTGSNSSSDVTITLLHDYHDYDFIMFEYIYSSNSKYNINILTTPEIMDESFTNGYSNYLNMGGAGGDLVYIAKVSNTEFTFKGGLSGSGYIKNIYGCKINANISKTMLYARGSVANTNVTPEIENFLDYDIIVMSTCSDRTKLGYYPTFCSKSLKGFVNGGYMYLWDENTHKVSQEKYFAIQGIKFT